VEHAIYLHATDPDLLCSNAVPGAPQARD
jgi:hypothetical protein